MRTVLTLLAVLSLAGCGSKQTTQAFLKRITPPQDDRLARAIIEDLRTGNLKPVVEKLERTVFGDQPEEVLGRLREYIDPAEPKAVELVGAAVRTMGDRKVVALSYQLEFPSSWSMVQVTIRTMGTSRHVVGLRAYRLPASLEEVNAFTLRGKSLRHWLMLTAAIAIPLFIIATLILCLGSEIRFKWLWIPFILIGVGNLSFNWMSGEFLFSALPSDGPFVWVFHISCVLPFMPLGASLARSGWCGPWTLSVSVPVGAIVFLLRQRALAMVKASGDAASLPEPPASPTEENP